MGLYPKVPYVLGKDAALLHCERKICKKIWIRRNLPGNIIVIHGVNDAGVSYKAVETVCVPDWRPGWDVA